jgi:hypothetical protein
MNANQSDRVRVYEGNPRFWQYKGRPVLLLGATDDENLFQRDHEEVVEQLDRLVAAGGNYDRCTMTGRPELGFEIYPHKKLPDGKYDLGQWNDAYWSKLQGYLEACHERDIVVQLEIWALDVGMEHYPYNPENNVNFRGTDTRYRFVRDMAAAKRLFYASVPELGGGEEKLLAYQKAFVDKVLSRAFPYENILYCVDNEFRYTQSWKWSMYWARYIRKKAEESGRQIEITEMNQTDWGVVHALEQGRKLTKQDRKRLGGRRWPYSFNVNHRSVYDNPQVYSYIDFSDNANAKEQEHWDNLQAVRSYIGKAPRPINHVKIYGADFGPRWGSKEGIDKFWRNIFGGSASARFHRTPYGLAQAEIALASIRGAREVQKYLPPWECEPRNDLLSQRPVNQAYAMARKDRQALGVFIPGSASGNIWFRLKAPSGWYKARWLNICRGAWEAEQPRVFCNGYREISELVISPPLGKQGDLGWVLVLVRDQGT